MTIRIAQAEHEAHIDSLTIPTGWVRHNYYTWMHPHKRLGVIVGVEIHDDGKKWIHVSVSHQNKIPNYESLCMVKRLWVGEERKAVQVFPPKSEHVNDHLRCLHLWACLDGDGLPDFRREGSL